MNRLRARFVRGEEVKYISHLDTLRTFERAVRRAGIPIAYSQGFNPRPQMSFGLPLAVGVTSTAEYVDLEMEEEISAKEFTEKINNNFPKGFTVTNAEYVTSKGTLMASIRVATYEVKVTDSAEINKEEINKWLMSFLNKEAIVVDKETKGTTKKIDIRPYIYEMTIIEFNEGTITMRMIVSAGSVFNLKPELVLKAFNQVCESDFKISKIHRTGLFGQDGKTLE